jgi:hypothetical protein
MKKVLTSIGIAACLVTAIYLIHSGPVSDVPPDTKVGVSSAPAIHNQVAAPAAPADIQSSKAVNTVATEDYAPAASISVASSVGKPQTIRLHDRQYPQRTYQTLQVPDDPLANQWWVGNAKLAQAWDVPRGNHQTTLAIIDTGFGLQHEEFANRWYVNPGESGVAAAENPSVLNCTGRSLPVTAGCNLIDDDGDSVVDNETGPASYQNPSKLNCSARNVSLAKSCRRRQRLGFYQL